MYNRRMQKVLTLILSGVLACSVLACAAACSTSDAQEASPASQKAQDDAADLEAAYPLADISSYACAEGYGKTYRLLDMTVADVVAEMDAGRSFVVYCGFDDCPWCNSVLNHFNDILEERGLYAAYLDTRKDPSWSSNLDMADYDLFVDRFGDALSNDDSGIKHLYVPHVFFVKAGVLEGDHPGTVAGHESPADPLTDEQIQEYRAAINTLIDQI